MSEDIFAQKNKMPIFRALNFKRTSITVMPTAPSYRKVQTQKVHSHVTTSQMLQTNIDLEFVLDRTKDILDYQAIQDYFNQKWKTKLAPYKTPVQEAIIDPDITLTNEISLKEAVIIFHLSSTRLVYLYLHDFQPTKKYSEDLPSLEGNTFELEKFLDNLNSPSKTIAKDRCYRQANSTVQWDYQSRKVVAYHKKTELGQSNLGQQDTIFTAEDVNLQHFCSESQRNVKLFAHKLDGHLPENLRFCAIISEILKQINHAKDWLRIEKGLPQPPLKRKALQFSLSLNYCNIGLQEEHINEIFVMKNDIMDHLNDRDVYAPSANQSLPEETTQTNDPILTLLKNLKKSAIYGKVIEFEMRNMKLQYEIPAKYLDNFDLVYNLVLGLDEVSHFMQKDFFKAFKYQIFKFSFGYLAVQSRNFYRPLFEFWDLIVIIDYINSELNSDKNQELFLVPIKKKIFQKFAIEEKFNRLPNKQYYKGQIKVEKARVAVQGKQTFLFFHDFQKNFWRLFSFMDISKSLDPKKQKLPFYVGVDRLRNQKHGNMSIECKTGEVLIWPKRNFNRLTSKNRLVITANDIECGHEPSKSRNQDPNRRFLLQYNFCCRNFVVHHEPLKQFESAFLKFPLIELHFQTNVNRDQNQDHFAYLKAKHLDHYMEILRQYASSELILDLKVNLPSFGAENQTRLKSLHLPSLMQSYIINSPVPVVHYQRAHLQYIAPLLKEFITGGNIDIYKRVQRKKINPNKIRSNRKHLFGINLKSFCSDLILIFSDFDERYYSCDNEKTRKEDMLNPADIEDDTLRDKYLKLYNGLVLSTENLKIKANIDATDDLSAISINSYDSHFQNNFFRISNLKTANLFDIRHKLFQAKRKTQNLMDNFKYFCEFFELDHQEENSVRNSNQDKITSAIQHLEGFKTLYPHYVSQNHNIQSDIAAAQVQNQAHQNNKETSYIDDFVFSENDTIAIVELMEYTQDAEIEVKEQEDKQVSPQKNQPTSRSSPGELNNSDFTHAASDKYAADVIRQASNQEFGHQEQPKKVKVYHLIDIQNIRWLFTKKLFEKITHLIVKGFNFSKYHKSIHLRSQTKRNFLKEYQSMNQRESKNKSTNQEQKGTELNLRNLKKEALIALRVTKPQVNCQNEVTQSQMLMTSEHRTLAIIFGYSKPTKGLSFTRQKNKIKLPDIVKYEVNTLFEQVNCYVAPTFINMQNPTFWMSEQRNLDQSVELDVASLSSLLLGNSDEKHQAQKKNNDSWDQVDNLTRVFSISNFVVTIEFLQSEYVDHVHPKQAIDFKVNNLKCKTDGLSLQHLISVTSETLFTRGEMSEELIQMEEAMKNDLQEIKIEKLRDLIAKEVQNAMKKVGLEQDSVKPKLHRKISYLVETINFELLGENKSKFASGQIENTIGGNYIYSNRDSKIDMECGNLKLFNHFDTDEGFSQVIIPISKEQKGAETIMADTMIKLRARDKYVVVREAPWRIFDQLEVFVLPMQICMSKNFYLLLKQFFFEGIQQKTLKEQIESNEKYDMLVPATTKLKKGQLKKKENEVGIEEESGDEHAISHFGSDNTKLQPRVQDWSHFPQFFRYMRINEVNIQITYFRGKNHMMNIKDYKLKLPPLISHGTFMTYKKTLELYESHCKRNFIAQVPSLIKQKALQFKQLVSGKTDTANLTSAGVAMDRNQSKKEEDLSNARRILLGDFGSSI